MRSGSIPKPLTTPSMPKIAKMPKADGDLISRQTVIDLLMSLPSVEPERERINYQYCSNAMLFMWLDEVVTDSEYNRIMDKLNAHWMSQEGNDE